MVHHKRKHFHHTKRHHHGGHHKGRYGSRSHSIIRKLGASSWFPRRTVVRGTVALDWAPLTGIADAPFTTPVKMNSIYRPFNGFGATIGYTGLSSLISSLSGQTNSIYSRARVTWSKIKFYLAPVSSADIASLELFLFPNNSPVSGVPEPTTLYAANQPFVKRTIALAGASKPTMVENQISVRKFAGVDLENFGQNYWYNASDTDDPVNLLNWIIVMQKVGGGAIADNTYAYKIELEAIIELDEPYDAAIIDVGNDEKGPGTDQSDEKDYEKMEIISPIKKLKIETPIKPDPFRCLNKPKLTRT